MIDQLIDAIKATQNPVCVGIDTDFAYLPDAAQRGVCDSENPMQAAAEQILAFNESILKAVSDVVPSVKVQIAYYEKFGVAGMQCFAETLRLAKQLGLIVIADAKRNDIGSTAAAYSTAFLGETDFGGRKIPAPFACDILTVNGYLGSDGLKPFLEDCKRFQKGLFALVKTSNPSSGELQNLRFENGNTLFEQTACLIETLGADLIGKYGFSSLGAVVGATHRQEAEQLRKRFPHMFFLIPGYGAQGGKASDLAVCFDRDGLGGVVNSSRGILCAYRAEQYRGMSPETAARRACLDMKADILGALKASGKERIG